MKKVILLTLLFLIISCEKSEVKLSDLEKEQSEVDKSVKGKESEIGSNPSMKDSLLNDIQSKKTDTERIKIKLQELKAESDRLERLTMKELQEIQKEIRKDWCC